VVAKPMLGNRQPGVAEQRMRLGLIGLFRFGETAKLEQALCPACSSRSASHSATARSVRE